MKAITGKVRRLFGDERAETRATIAEASEEIRRLINERPQLERELALCQERVDRAREQLELVDPARTRLEQAKLADAADRRRRVEDGTPGSDPELVATVKAAQDALADAEAGELAAKESLPGLEQRLREKEEAIENAARRIDAAVWRRRMAELSLQLPEVRAAAATLTDFRRELAAVADVALRSKLYGTPSGDIPKDMFDACAITPFAETLDSGLRSAVHGEIVYLRRLRDDPGA